MKLKRLRDFDKDFDDIPISNFWSISDKIFSKRHEIHTYPAKFPPLLVDRAIEFARRKNVEINSISDIFCGCGTTALESLLSGKRFWGIDCNPVATLITKVKTASYNPNIIRKYFFKIINSFQKRTMKRVPQRILNNTRLRYWYRDKELEELNALLIRVNKIVPEGKYRDFFLCSFSGILKKTSFWLQKSIKPTMDYNKIPHDVFKSFSDKYNQNIRAIEKMAVPSLQHTAFIKKGNIIAYQGKIPKADLLITSPPYATSYEYADLHQLSSLWLDYAKDFRFLRKGSIGSIYGIDKDYSQNLNCIGKGIVTNLKSLKKRRKAKFVAKYFYDMSKVIRKIDNILRPGGIGVIIIGNTEYFGTKIDNTKYLAYELFSQKMKNIKVYKREIGAKILTRHRDKKGRFSNKKNSKDVYHCEFLITFQAPL